MRVPPVPLLPSGVSMVAKPWGRPLVEIDRPLPLIGTVFIGVIDRGTNILQVRPTTLCPLNCIFCSVDAGPRSRWRRSEYQVRDPAYLASWAGEIASYKGGGVEALVDGVGDPFAYPRLVELVAELKGSDGIRWVAVETHGWGLRRDLIDRLEEAGLDRVNLSIDTLNPEKARYLAGTPWYDVERVKRLAEYIVKETSIDLHVTPVWVPGLNDEDVKDVVRWAYTIGAGKRWPPATIQKYNIHKHGRKPRGVREVPWREFWAWIRSVEEELGLRVSWSMEEWGFKRAPQVEVPYKKGSRVRARVLAPGWLKGTTTGITLDGRWLLTLRGEGYRPGSIVSTVVESVKDTIVIVRPV
ncbi:MAG: radical SAM protein [Desulfurococcales archaeon]|nr:radical SAM protein [Desulfurococcales archaeon]